VTEDSTTLAELAHSLGIATEFWDWQGHHVQVADSTMLGVMKALDVDASSPELARQALAERTRASWARMLPPCVVHRQGIAASFPVHVPHGSPVSVWIELEAGGVRSDLKQLENWAAPVDVGGRHHGEATFELPFDLPLGYHTLRAESAGEQASTPLITTPDWLGLPPRTGGRRIWGIATQLYSVTSEQSWGLGDLADLADLAIWSTVEHGAGFVLVNPLHAAEPIVPMEPSPYLPTSRRFGNPIYLRPERIPEYADLAAAARGRIAAVRDKLRAEALQTGTLDRDRSWVAKREALQLIHAVSRSAGREVAYQSYQRTAGNALTEYATWCAIAEQHGADWRTWPEELRRPESAAVLEFAESHSAQVDFHRWLQWVMDEQLGAAQFAAVRSGSALGIVRDLAVGVQRGGADAWRLQEIFARNVTVGAPPDAYNQNGQDWNQPPWRPDRLAEVAYAPFRELVAAELRSAGGLRVDHIIGLFRLWWIPEGAPPTQGTYIRYDHEALIGVLALEAHRAQALVVGEDLGTVEPWVRNYLSGRGILGTSILWFEFDFDAGGGPLRPEGWRELCLASVTTHDLPPTAGYLAGDHVRLRDSLGLLTRSLDEELAADAADRTAWLDELRDRGALGQGLNEDAVDALDPAATNPPDEDVEEIVLALHRFLALTRSKMLAVSLTDMVGDRRTQNQPGTIDEYPNWRVPLSGPDGQPVSLEEVMSSSRAARLAEAMRS
jgi:4-alpha-glucanotransferase